MKRIALFSTSLILLVGISVTIFDRLHLYDEFIWLDIPMHFIGGFLAFGFLESVLRYKKIKHDMLLTLAIFLIAASVWELNEYFVREVTERTWFGFFDTIKDYCMGAFGLFFGHYVLYTKKHL